MGEVISGGDTVSPMRGKACEMLSTTHVIELWVIFLDACGERSSSEDTVRIDEGKACEVLILSHVGGLWFRLLDASHVVKEHQST